MELIDLLALLVYTFGAMTFGALAVAWVRDRRRLGADFEGSHWLYGFMTFYACVWFLVCILTVFGAKPGKWAVDRAAIALWVMSFVWPPFIMHTYYVAARPRLSRPRPWKLIVMACYPASYGLMLLPLLFLLAVLPLRVLSWASFGTVFLFSATAVYCAALSTKMRKSQESFEERRLRIWHSLLWGLVIVLMLVMVMGAGGFYNVLALATRCLPLLFIFVNVYYTERFTFFDVLVKRGLFVFLALLLLGVFVSAASALSSRLQLGAEETWFYALILLPLGLSLPWLYRQLEGWLDRVWLGRRFSPVAAVKHFLSGVQMATSEGKLLKLAEERLAAIFQADTRIKIPAGRTSGPAVKGGLSVPISLEGKNVGVIEMGRRLNNMPFFSKDVALLTSLVDVLSYLLENVRLQQKKQQQEKKEKELVIHASRSELKALRAQINPHFLFNALNAIAGLIHKDPLRAEETVEQLAEVFRYTLRGSEKEWARLEDEMEFVRAYLEVEQARFGDRLRTSFDLDEALGEIRIPAMMIQTLVENAVKHGVASVRGVGCIAVSVQRLEGRIRIEVRDNGPGFAQAHAEDSIPPSKKGAGYGLRNVRDRLQGYYGSEAHLSLSRDEERQSTVVSIEVPAKRAPFRKTGTS